MVVLFLTPYLGLSSALQSVAPIIAAQLHMSLQAVNLTSGLANAGYAAGAVVAVQFSQLLPQRRMLLVYGIMLVAGSALAAAATSPAMFIAGHVLQGLSTGLLLIAAAPPLFLGYPANKLRWTVMILDMCIFGAVRHGPAEHVLGRTPARIASGHGSGGRIAASLTSLPHRHAVHGRGDHVGPVVFAYDGSDLAKAAIAEAGRQLPAKREALVLTVWRTFNVGFLPEPGAKFDAACADEVKQAAEQTAMHGASLAEAAGFRAQAGAVEGTPTWKAIVDTADDHQASLIVLGSRGRAGLGLVAGSVAGAVASRSLRPVFIVHGRDGAPTPETSASATASEAVHNEVLK